MVKTVKAKTVASSRGRYINSGNGLNLQVIDIGHETFLGVVDPDTAFWSLVPKTSVGNFLDNSPKLKKYLGQRAKFVKEMETLRFGLSPTAVYFNPTERCNLNCTYCYIPETMRKNGQHMSPDRLIKALEILKHYFRNRPYKKLKPQVVFHGSEPLLAKEALFAGIEQFRNDFRFGIQTNSTLLDEPTLEFIKKHNIGLGLSLDGSTAQIADRTRKSWDGKGVFFHVVSAIERLKDYPNYNVICTATKQNMKDLVHIVDFLHELEVPVCMLNPVRCTLPGARTIKPLDHELSFHYLKALDRSYELFKRTGRKLVVANFANVLVSIVAPTARRLMCDISPCGGGRCFFALSAKGDLFPCSEFIGVPEFNGGNLFKGQLETALKSEAFHKVTSRKVEDIAPCSACAIRHFCGSPCPAEASEMQGSMQKPGAFCELYEDQVRYALRLIADDKVDAFLWDGWDKGTVSTFSIAAS